MLLVGPGVALLAALGAGELLLELVDAPEGVPPVGVAWDAPEVVAARPLAAGHVQGLELYQVGGVKVLALERRRGPVEVIGLALEDQDYGPRDGALLALAAGEHQVRRQLPDKAPVVHSRPDGEPVAAGGLLEEIQEVLDVQLDFSRGLGLNPDVAGTPD